MANNIHIPAAAIKTEFGADETIPPGNVQFVSLPRPSSQFSAFDSSQNSPAMLGDPSLRARTPLVTQKNVITVPVHIRKDGSTITGAPSITNKRPLPVFGSTQMYAEPKRRRGERGTGLRLFAMKVCEKVRRKKITSYNEVADELVAEYGNPEPQSLQDQQYDQKNIRRRVYDALNVLMAMDIVSKEKKEIRWLGLPLNSAAEVQTLEDDRCRRFERVKQKSDQLHQLILQQVAIKNLIERNQEAEVQGVLPSPNAVIQLPFITVNTDKKTTIDCSISNDKSEYLFTFDNTFEIQDDAFILNRMGLTKGLDEGKVSQEDLESCLRHVPKAMEPHVLEMAKRKTPTIQSMTAILNALPKAGRRKVINSIESGELDEDEILRTAASPSEIYQRRDPRNPAEGSSTSHVTALDPYSDDSMSSASDIRLYDDSDVKVEAEVEVDTAFSSSTSGTND